MICIHLFPIHNHKNLVFVMNSFLQLHIQEHRLASRLDYEKFWTYKGYLLRLDWDLAFSPLVGAHSSEKLSCLRSKNWSDCITK